MSTPALTAEQIRHLHVLLLPAEVDPEDVEALVVTRHPEADQDDGAYRIGRHLRLVGPLEVDDALADAIEAPRGWPLMYVLDSPVEREDPPLPGTSHPDGLHRAFHDGMPVRAEARGVELLVAIARRLDGAVRVADPYGTGTVLRPDPGARIDLVVHSPYWLEPDTLLGVVRLHEPGARLALDGEQWMGPPRGLVDNPADEAAAALRPELRVALHAQADRYDAAALAGDDVLDAYAVVVDLGPEGRFGGIEVMAHPEEVRIPALAGVEWADDVISYEVRWTPPDERERALEDPSPEYVASRAVAATAVGLIASAVVEATDGVLVDSDGFLVDRYDI
ncbi:hypothetical protein [Thalassiella azotivora]